MSWGYNVELYRSLETSIELQTTFKTFQTWRGYEDPFTFNTRPVIPDQCKRPVVFFLDQIEDGGLGEWTESSYKIYDNVLLEKSNCSLEVQYVNVTASYFRPELWKKVKR